MSQQIGVEFFSPFDVFGCCYTVSCLKLGKIVIWDNALFASKVKINVFNYFYPHDEYREGLVTTSVNQVLSKSWMFGST